MVAKSLHRSVDLVNSVGKSLVRNQLIKRKDRILLSISGGQDSICLLAILNQFFAQMELNVGLLWCHHLWQIDSFSLMRQITKISYLFQLNSCFAVTPKPVLSELLARNWRHDCSYRICFFYNYYKISLAHSANDKAETILLNLMRGTGVAGLSPLPWEKKNNENRFKKEKPISQFFTFPVFFFIWSPFFLYKKHFKITIPMITRSLNFDSNLIQMEDLNRFEQILNVIKDYNQKDQVNVIKIEDFNNFIDIRVGNKNAKKVISKDELKKNFFVDQLNLNIKHVDKHFDVIKDYNQIPKCSNFLEIMKYLQQISAAVSAIELKNKISWMIEKTKLKKKRNRLSHHLFSQYMHRRCKSTFVDKIEDFNQRSSTLGAKKVMHVERSSRKKKACIFVELRSTLDANPVFLDTTKDCKQKKKINSKKWFYFVSYTFLKTCSTSLEQIQPLDPMDERCKGVRERNLFDFSIRYLEYPFATSANKFLTNFLDVQPKESPSFTSPSFKIFDFNVKVGDVNAITSKQFFICQIEDSWCAGWQWSSVNGVTKETGSQCTFVERSSTLDAKKVIHCIKIDNVVDQNLKKKAVFFKCIKPNKEVINKNKIEDFNQLFLAYSWQSIGYCKTTDKIEDFNQPNFVLNKHISSTIRPLLSLNRFDISKLCIFWQLPVYPDQSNQKLNFLRNRVRKQLLPVIKLFFNSRIENVLLQFAEIFSAEDFYMHQITDKFFKKLSMVIQPVQPLVVQLIKNEMNSKVYPQSLACYPGLIKNDAIFGLINEVDHHPRRFKPSLQLDKIEDGLIRSPSVKEVDHHQDFVKINPNTGVLHSLLSSKVIHVERSSTRKKVIECEIFSCSLRFLKFSIFNCKPNELLKNTSIFVKKKSFSLSRKYQKNGLKSSILSKVNYVDQKYLHFFQPVQPMHRVQTLQSIESVSHLLFSQCTSPIFTLKSKILKEGDVKEGAKKVMRKGLKSEILKEKVDVIKEYNQIVYTKYKISLPLFSDLVHQRQLGMSLAKLIDRKKINQLLTSPSFTLKSKILKEGDEKSFKSTKTLLSHLYTNYFLINLIDHDKLIFILSCSPKVMTKFNLIKSMINYVDHGTSFPFKTVYKNVDVLHPIKTIPRLSGPMGATFWVWNRKFCLAKELNKDSKKKGGGALLSTFNHGVNYNTNLFNTTDKIEDFNRKKKNTNFLFTSPTFTEGDVNKIEDFNQEGDYQNIFKSNLFYKKKGGNVFTHNFLFKFDTFETKKKEIYWPLIISFLPTALQRRFVKLFLVKQNWQQVRYSQIEQFLTIIKKLSL